MNESSKTNSLRAVARSRFSRLLLRTTLLGLLVVGASIVAPVGCGGRQSGEEQTYSEAAESLYGQARRAVRRSDYEYARQLFNEVTQKYPYSRFAALSEFQVAEAWFEERSYARAIEAYRRFIRFRPSHEKVPSAYFKIARSYVEQVPSDIFILPPAYERDLGPARQAETALRTFLDRYPESEHGESARAELARVVDLLAGHELFVAEFYMERENPVATKNRCAHLFERFPDAAQVPNCLLLTARAQIFLGEERAAVDTLRQLVARFPETRLARQARAWLREYAARVESADVPDSP